jgi:hypothetical protein
MPLQRPPYDQSSLRDVNVVPVEPERLAEPQARRAERFATA